MYHSNSRVLHLFQPLVTTTAVFHRDHTRYGTKFNRLLWILVLCQHPVFIIIEDWTIRSMIQNAWEKNYSCVDLKQNGISVDLPVTFHHYLHNDVIKQQMIWFTKQLQLSSNQSRVLWTAIAEVLHRLTVDEFLKSLIGPHPVGRQLKINMLC